MDGSTKIYTQVFDDVLLQEHLRIRAMRGEKPVAAKGATPAADTGFTGLATPAGRPRRGERSE